jgi:hypothetical protein
MMIIGDNFGNCFGIITRVSYRGMIYYMTAMHVIEGLLDKAGDAYIKPNPNFGDVMDNSLEHVLHNTTYIAFESHDLVMFKENAYWAKLAARLGWKKIPIIRASSLGPRKMYFYDNESREKMVTVGKAAQYGLDAPALWKHDLYTEPGYSSAYYA